MNCPACKNDPDKKASCPACGGTGKSDVSRAGRRAAGTKTGLVKAMEVRQRNASRLHAELCPKVLAMRHGGMTLRQIADRLNEEGWTTPRKKEWNGVYVCRFLKQC